MALSLAAVGLAGCSSTKAGGGVAVAAELRAVGVARTTQAGVDVKPLVDGMTAFGHDLYGVAAKDGGNVVISPLSIAAAFSMARAGAGGTTASEIDQVLHFPLTARDSAMNALTRDLATRDTAPPRPTPMASRSAGPPADPIVTVANGLFVQHGLPVGDAFLHTLAAEYGAGVRTVDFKSAAAAEQINAWVRQQTAERISKLFDKLDSSTQLVLANAVYVKADWAVPFGKAPTTDDSFALANGAKVTAPTMHQTEDMGYSHGNGWQAVEIPYAGNTLAMWVIVPTSTATPLGHLLSSAALSSVAGAMHPTFVSLSLPRWSTTSELDLVRPMSALGMRAPFSPAADFSAISPGLYIAQAVHRATITVDEWGTEAAAVTGLGFVASGRAGEPVVVRADHPFAFAIVHKPTGAVLFEGSVADPTKH
jgi:serine protease inhibitor